MVSFEWNPISYQPGEIEWPILCWTTNDKLMVLKNTYGFYNGDSSNKFSDWKNLVDKYHIKYWVYQAQLIKNPYDYE